MTRFLRRNWTIRGGVVTPVYKIILYYFIASKKTKNYHLILFLVTISVFNKPEFDWKQMRLIRLGLEMKWRVEKYATPEYSASQLAEILAGLRDGLDVSKYDNSNKSWVEMALTRTALLKEKQ